MQIRVNVITLLNFRKSFRKPIGPAHAATVMVEFSGGFLFPEVGHLEYCLFRFPDSFLMSDELVVFGDD